jgi:hypothetical protein
VITTELPVVLEDLPVEPGEDLVAQTLIAEVANHPEARLGYFVGEEEAQERGESALLLFQIVLDDVVGEEWGGDDEGEQEEKEYEGECEFKGVEDCEAQQKAKD